MLYPRPHFSISGSPKAQMSCPNRILTTCHGFSLTFSSHGIDLPYTLLY